MGMNHDASTYEDIHFNDIKKQMKRGDVVYDIGVYDGITAVLVAQAVGAENVVLVEPAENNWGTIKAYWEKHGFDAPRATYAGFVCDQDRADYNLKALVYRGEFPWEAAQHPVSFFEEHSRFRTIQVPDDRPYMKIDTLVKYAGAPAGITIDIEGAELLALFGAVETLKIVKPIVWVSIHPSFMKERFGHTKDSLLAYMNELGYDATLLAVDHEEHYRFTPRTR